MSDAITGLHITGLFGRLDHDIKLQTQPRITILTGPNGSGKTHALRLLEAIARLDFRTAAPLPFVTATATYASGRTLELSRNISESTESALMSVVGRSSGGRKAGGVQIDVSADEDYGDEELPPWIEDIGRGRYYDTRHGRVISRQALMRRYGVNPIPYVDSILESNPWLASYGQAGPPTLIEAGRLDLTPSDLRHAAMARHEPRQEGLIIPKRIQQYVDRISGEIGDARRESFMVSQQADRRFAARALDKARARVREANLRARYERIAALHQELHHNALTEEAIGVEFPAADMNPTERRIINIFLDDWEKKLAPLLPVHDKLQILRGVVGSKMADKNLHIGSRGQLGFWYQDTDEPISVDMLSSGEQHLLALYTVLLFGTDRGGLVLIDEPEISLHAGWKHQFVEDMERIADVNSLTIVMATHSTAIINGRWELVQEMALN